VYNGGLLQTEIEKLCTHYPIAREDRASARKKGPAECTESESESDKGAREGTSKPPLRPKSACEHCSLRRNCQIDRWLDSRSVGLVHDSVLVLEHTVGTEHGLDAEGGPSGRRAQHYAVPEGFVWGGGQAFPPVRQ